MAGRVRRRLRDAARVGGTVTLTASRPTPARAKPATAGIPVAIMSAEASLAIIGPMRASGAVAYLTEPVGRTEPGQLLDSFAAGHKHEASLALGTGPTP